MSEEATFIVSLAGDTLASAAKQFSFTMFRLLDTVIFLAPVIPFVVNRVWISHGIPVSDPKYYRNLCRIALAMPLLILMELGLRLLSDSISLWFLIGTYIVRSAPVVAATVVYFAYSVIRARALPGQHEGTQEST